MGIFNFDEMLTEIINFRMNKEEALAYRAGITYMQLCQQLFPGYRHESFRQKSDPRKSILFRYCLKMVKELKDKLDHKEHRAYIKAQLQLFKNIGDTNISCNILVGEKAWIRWLVWKKKFEQTKQINQSSTEISGDQLLEIKNQMIRSMKILDKHKIDIETAYKTGKLKTWLTLGVITPYIVLCQNKEYDLDIDTQIYKITPEIQQIYDSVCDV